MRLVTAVAFLFVLANHLAAAPVPKESAKESYYPTAPGTKWVYRQENREWAEEITKSDRRKAETLLTVRITEGGTSYDDTYSITDGGLTKLTTGEFRIERLLLKLPVKKGNEWSVDVPVQAGLLAEGGTAAAGDAEAVDVPAGQYRAVPVRFTVTKADGRELPKPGRTYTHWYAPDVGLVKFRCKDGGAEVVRVLKAFTPAAKK
ncbi:hypothetical protein [Limnoglobus roseus]|uniref:Uncharacterized protein n=1 Tax=Limnoglobus roseus TaxID=2598579 RepID=A0A5C1ASP3_9BACT|nr:hypothetical protein [Limnoglobus roseus]QEL19928.1 hypothetical protein PX52LOC_07010 [Limnoglobus roseus]